MNFFHEKKDDVSIITFRYDRLDAKVSVDFKAYIKEIIDQGNYLLIIDMSKIDFIDSTGLVAIITSLKYLKNRGDIVITGVKPTLMSLFELTKMDKIFKICKDIESSILELKK